MISAQFPLHSWFLVIGGAIFAVAFALPILLAPLTWARLFRWQLPANTELTVYFGRCVGALGLAVVAVGFIAAPHPEQHVILFDLLIAVGGGLTAVHVWGAVERSQPWTETAEIAMYLGLTIAAVLLRRLLGGL